MREACGKPSTKFPHGGLVECISSTNLTWHNAPSDSNFFLSTTPFPPVSSNIRTNVTIIVFQRYLTILCPPLPLPPQYLHVTASRSCAPLDPLICPRRELRSLPHTRLLGTGTSHTNSAPWAPSASYLLRRYTAVLPYSV